MESIYFAVISPLWKMENRYKIYHNVVVSRGKMTVFLQYLPIGYLINKLKQEFNKMAFLLQNLSLYTWKHSVHLRNLYMNWLLAQHVECSWCSVNVYTLCRYEDWIMM